MPNADAQTGEAAFVAEAGDHALHAVVAVVAAAGFQTADAHRKGHFVVGDQNLLRRDLVEARQGADRLAGQVHVGGRQQQPRFSAKQAGAASKPLELALRRERRTEARGQRLKPARADVVPGAGVARAGIAEAGDQANRHGGVPSLGDARERSVSRRSPPRLRRLVPPLRRPPLRRRRAAPSRPPPACRGPRRAPARGFPRLAAA